MRTPVRGRPAKLSPLPPLHHQPQHSPRQAHDNMRISKHALPEAILSWDIDSAASHSKANSPMTSFRPAIRAIIKAKIEVARASEPHFNALVSNCDSMRRAKHAQQHAEWTRMRSIIDAQIHNADPRYRHTLMTERTKKFEQHLQRVAEKKREIDLALYESIQASMVHDQHSTVRLLSNDARSS